MVKTSSGRIRKDTQPNSYLLLPDSASKEVVISVWIKDNAGKHQLKGAHTFKVQSPVNPMISWGSIDRSGIYEKPLIRSASFVLMLPDANNLGCMSGISYRVTEYKIVFLHSNGKTESIIVQDCAITEDIKKIIETLETNDRFIISDVKVRGPQGVFDISNSLEIVPK